ncbi:MAG: chromosomal replication initiation protein [Parcubacteria group bacterium GW2011_GWC2_38_7]|nr:MAG: chromosomal replication initiation protein [Parcubacteria group bacterium GW2011_GWC2_38_7]
MEDVNQEIWQAVLGELELSLSKASFTTWLKNTFIIENEDGRIVVGVPNTFSQAWLKQKYHTEIYRIIQNKSKERIKEITYKVQTVKNYQQEQDQIKKTIIAEARQYQADVKTRPAIGEQAIGLNTKYCFDTFVVGKGNELVHAAAKAVAEKPGITYNPLFIYGGVGLGKTHIMQAIGHEILKNSPEKKVVYVTCEQFTNDFINAVSSGRTEKFNATYRTPDVLLIDDIQFLAGKEGTQETFFHTFNALHQNDKQIVLTSDRPPKAIATLEDRLLSRFEWGMIADISQPDLETRIAILETKCVEKNFPLERDIIQYITLNIQNNIRELEGALNKIIAHHQLNHITPTLENVKKILFSISSASKQSGAVSARQLIELVSEFYDLTLEELLGKSREKRLAFPRQIIMYLLREELRCSYPTIGHELGGRDHTTAMHAYEKISGIIEDDEKLRQEINLIKQKVYAH